MKKQTTKKLNNEKIITEKKIKLEICQFII